MVMLAKILPSSDFTARLLYCEVGNRGCTSLIQIIRKNCQDLDLRCGNSSAARWGIKSPAQSFLAIASIDCHGLEREQSMRNVRKSLLEKSKNADNQDIHHLTRAITKIVLQNKNMQSWVSEKDLNNNGALSSTLGLDERKSLKRVAYSLQLKPILWNRNILVGGSRNSLTNTFPMIVCDKRFSTTSHTALVKRVEEVVTNAKRNASSSRSHNNWNPNHKYSFISKFFDTENLLMSSDAYNQALVEAAKRRTTLKKCNAVSQQVSRLQIIDIRASNRNHKSSNSCPPPSKVKKPTETECKKDNPRKPSDCLDPCKEELEKVRKSEETQKKKNSNKKPTGCESPKCKRDDCNKPPKSPCKTAADQKSEGGLQRAETTLPTPKPKKSYLCSDKEGEYIPKCNTDPCKTDNPASGETTKPGPSTIPNKSDALREDPINKKNPRDPCERDNKQRDPCKKRETLIHKNDPCASKTKDPCRDRKARFSKCNKEDSHNKTLEENPCKKYTGDSGTKEKGDLCKKEKITEQNPSKKEKQLPQAKDEKQDSCKKRNKSPCETKKEQEDPCRKRKIVEDSAKKDSPDEKNIKQDPCKKKPKKPCDVKKEKEHPSEEIKKSPCAIDSKREKAPSSTCIPQKNTKVMSQPSSSTSCDMSNPKRETKPNCVETKKSFSTLAAGTNQTRKRETKPNCGSNEKQYSTLAAITDKSSAAFIMQPLKMLPFSSYRKCCTFNFRRLFSSKRKDKNKQSTEDLGKTSLCKSVGTRVPPQRKPAYNPHPKGGLRQCYPTYDMDCKKLCKDARKTNCKKYAFLDDTDNNERNKKK